MRNMSPDISLELALVYRLWQSPHTGTWLLLSAVLLGYLGAHEAQTRRDMARIAAWRYSVLPPSEMNPGMFSLSLPRP